MCPRRIGEKTVDRVLIFLKEASLGLGTLWDDFAVAVANDLPEVYEMLNIPDGYKLSFILTFGEPAVNYKRVPQKDAHSITVI